jgi:hypothetical protein
MKVIRHTVDGQKVYSEIGCKVLEFFFEPAFSVIEILAGTLIDPHEVARADRFSDEVDGNDLRRVENFSTSQPRHDSFLRMTDTRKFNTTPA